MDQSPLSEVVTDAIAEHARDEGDYCVGWVLVSTWMRPTGERIISVTLQEDVQYWDAFGYLRSAQLELERQFNEQE